MSLILQCFRKGSLGVAHNLLATILKDLRKDPHLDHGREQEI
jgi:hypothetical protein